MNTDSNTDRVPPKTRFREVIEEAREGTGGNKDQMIGWLAQKVVDMEAAPRGELSPDEVGILRGFDEERRQ